MSFSNIQLEQQIPFLHNSFFIHPAIRDATPLFKQLSKKEKPSISNSVNIARFMEHQTGKTIEHFNGIPWDLVFI